MLSDSEKKSKIQDEWRLSQETDHFVSFYSGLLKTLNMQVLVPDSYLLVPDSYLFKSNYSNPWETCSSLPGINFSAWRRRGRGKGKP